MYLLAFRKSECQVSTSLHYLYGPSLESLRVQCILWISTVSVNQFFSSYIYIYTFCAHKTVGSKLCDA